MSAHGTAETSASRNRRGIIRNRTASVGALVKGEGLGGRTERGEARRNRLGEEYKGDECALGKSPEKNRLTGTELSIAGA